LADIESGKVANEGAYELLTLMGVSLTDSGKERLLGGASKNHVKAVERFAKDMAAEKLGILWRRSLFTLTRLMRIPSRKKRRRILTLTVELRLAA